MTSWIQRTFGGIWWWRCAWCDARCQPSKPDKATGLMVCGSCSRPSVKDAT